MNEEIERLKNPKWKKWGPYVSDRQWGTVREDYSASGDAWNYTSHDNAEAKTYRWGEEGIGGICDDQQTLCFALGLWNHQDKMVKERLFGLTNGQGNHGEDVKELYYYLDSSPTHSYMKMLYKYPQNAFPYDDLLRTNARRSRMESEYELIDTGIFDNDDYFDIFIEYAKADIEDLLIKITVINRGQQEAPLTLLPTLWFRNTWIWGYNDYKPRLLYDNDNILIQHKNLKITNFYTETQGEFNFTENETNTKRLYNWDSQSPYVKDGINRYVLTGNNATINKNKQGTKASIKLDFTVKPGESKVFKFRLCPAIDKAFYQFDTIFDQRKQETDVFYNEIQCNICDTERIAIQRQAFAGLLWSKQFYYYDVAQWLEGDPDQPKPPVIRNKIRNSGWKTLNNKDIISMPDKWEYPWYATWDLAFHCVSLAVIDSDFAKSQLLLFTREWFMHPNGKLPAYEWDFDNVNPPVHAWATFRVFKIDEKKKGKPDLMFLESVFQKLLINFTWWVNRKDKSGNNIFGGGFLGLDNIGVFDREDLINNGWDLEQTDGTGWMAMFSLNMMRIALELAVYNPVYEDMATKFFEHFLYIANALNTIGDNNEGLWDEEDGFFYSALRINENQSISLKLRSIVGLIPIFAVEVFEHDFLTKLPNFERRMQWILKYKPELVSVVARYEEQNKGGKHLLSMVTPDRLRRVLGHALNPNAFLSDYGIRALSKEYEAKPYTFPTADGVQVVKYLPSESDSKIFGGNSNWRGPIWFPLNFLLVESLQRFHFYFQDDFKVEYPTGSGEEYTLDEIASDLSNRLCNLFLRDENGFRPFNGNAKKIQTDPNFKDYMLFYEYFHGDNGRGLGAAHQTGWTALIAKLIQPRMQ